MLGLLWQSLKDSHEQRTRGYLPENCGCFHVFLVQKCSLQSSDRMQACYRQRQTFRSCCMEGVILRHCHVNSPVTALEASWLEGNPNQQVWGWGQAETGSLYGFCLSQPGFYFLYTSSSTGDLICTWSWHEAIGHISNYVCFESTYLIFMCLYSEENASNNIATVGEKPQEDEMEILVKGKT